MAVRCRGPVDTGLHTQIRNALQDLLDNNGQTERSDIAPDSKVNLDLTLNGYIHLLTPPAATQLEGQNASEPEERERVAGTRLSAAEARTFVEKLLQNFAEEASGRLAPQLPPLDPASMPSPRKEHVAATAQAAQKPKPPPFVPLGEVRSACL
jgi:hypothetical protein